MAKTPIYKSDVFKQQKFSEMNLYKYAKEALTPEEFSMFEKIVVLGYTRKEIQEWLGDVVKVSPIVYESLGINLTNKIIDYMDSLIKKK